MKPISVKECGRLFPLPSLSLPFRLLRTALLLASIEALEARSACSYKPPPFPVATFALAILLFRSRKIEYLCKLNGGGIDGRRQIEEVGREDNHMVRVNLGNNQEGRSNLAKNFRMGSGRTITLVN